MYSSALREVSRVEVSFMQNYGYNSGLRKLSRVEPSYVSSSFLVVSSSFPPCGIRKRVGNNKETVPLWLFYTTSL